ncbi:hypothetical protein [Methanococcoides sp. LMO-2]|uniref:DUF3795 domain-containing protein n=1 Tax=Methanococcoides cohabitans TaxID=3136559 RepID=A0ABU9KVL1_9EURY
MTVIEIGCCGAYCKTYREFKNKKCRGCRQFIEFIQKEGYEEFIKRADKWKNYYGKLG